MSGAEPGGPPRVFAHRGFAAAFPENTVAAVEGAVHHGADGIEVDVRGCASGEPVVIHDETVDRVTEASGRVAEYSASALAGMTVQDSQAGIPTLAAVVEAVPDEVALNVELKERDVTAAALAIAADHGGEVIVSSFDTGALETAKTVAPELPRGLIVDRRPRTAVRRTRAVDGTYVHPRTDLCLRSLLIRRAHRHGLGVTAWTLRSRGLAALLGGLGVDGLIADDPAIC